MIRAQLRAALAPVIVPAVVLAITCVAGQAQARTLGAIRFTPCDLRAPHQAQTLAAECARYEVAENPARPEGRKIALRLALVATRAEHPADDLVVYLAGGPGQSGLDSFLSYAPGFRDILRKRNVLLIDQRGTGGSNRLACPDAPDTGDAAEPTPAQRRAYVARCLAAIEPHADPRFYTTADAVRDLEALRLALGGPQFDLVGASYGTRLALSYLRAHPEGVRSVVLDGVVPQDEVLGQNHARNLDDALALIFAACRRDAACAQRYGDPAATLARLRERLRAQPLALRVADPRTQAPREAVLSEATLAATLRLMSYQPELASLAPLLIDEAAQGRAAPLLAQGLLLGRSVADLLAPGMALAVNCTEDAPFLKHRAEDAPRLLGNRLTDELIDQCAQWPAGALAADFRQPVVSGKPALLLSGEWDPVTPPRDAERAAATLANSRHLVARGRGHTVLWRGCLPKLAARFIETLAPKTLDAGCLDALAETPAFTSFQGPPP